MLRKVCRSFMGRGFLFAGLAVMASFCGVIAGGGIS